jgi:hypothetical protein
MDSERDLFNRENNRPGPHFPHPDSDSGSDFLTVTVNLLTDCEVASAIFRFVRHVLERSNFYSSALAVNHFL